MCLCIDDACKRGGVQLSLLTWSKDCRACLKRIQQEVGCCFRRSSQYWYWLLTYNHTLVILGINEYSQSLPSSDCFPHSWFIRTVYTFLWILCNASNVWEILATFQLKAWEKETRALSVLPYGIYSKYDTLLCFCELDILVLWCLSDTHCYYPIEILTQHSKWFPW